MSMTYEKIVQRNCKNIAVMKERIKNIDEKVDNIAEMVTTLSRDIKDNFVSKAEFWPYKMVVAGLATTTLLFVLNLFLGLVHID